MLPCGCLTTACTCQPTTKMVATLPRLGWQCVRCGACYSPDVRMCESCSPPRATTPFYTIPPLEVREEVQRESVVFAPRPTEPFQHTWPRDSKAWPFS